MSHGSVASKIFRAADCQPRGKQKGYHSPGQTKGIAFPRVTLTEAQPAQYLGRQIANHRAKKRDRIPPRLIEAEPATYLGQQINDHRAANNNSKTKQNKNQMNYLNNITTRIGLGATPHPATDIRGKGGGGQRQITPPKLATNGRGRGGRHREAAS